MRQMKVPAGEFLKMTDTMFIQASLSKIQGLFKDFSKPILQFSRTNSLKPDLSVKIVLQKS